MIKTSNLVYASGILIASLMGHNFTNYIVIIREDYKFVS